jgi:hypothetical protein
MGSVERQHWENHGTCMKRIENIAVVRLPRAGVLLRERVYPVEISRLEKMPPSGPARCDRRTVTVSVPPRANGSRHITWHWPAWEVNV